MRNLIKFTPKIYAEQFLSGEIYMNSLSYFWTQGFENQKDYLEGSYGVIDLAHLRNLPDDLTDTLDKGIVVIADAYKYCNLCCLYRLDIDERNKIIRLPAPAIDGFGDHAIIILDENKFVNRIAKQMKKNTEWKYLLGDVNYRKEIKDDIKSRIYFKSINTIKVDSICDERKSLRSRDCFDKVEKFSYQHEWRLCLLKDCNDSMPYTLKIGDLSDIAIIVKTKELRKIMLEMYQNYSIGEVVAQREAYQGNISRRNFREAIYDIDDKAYIAFSIG